MNNLQSILFVIQEMLVYHCHIQPFTQMNWWKIWIKNITILMGVCEMAQMTWVSNYLVSCLALIPTSTEITELRGNWKYGHVSIGVKWTNWHLTSLWMNLAIYGWKLSPFSYLVVPAAKYGIGYLFNLRLLHLNTFNYVHGLWRTNIFQLEVKFWDVSFESDSHWRHFIWLRIQSLLWSICFDLGSPSDASCLK